MSVMLLAAFETPGELSDALTRLHAAHIPGVESFTPMPMPSAPATSVLPLTMLIAGLLGTAGGFAMQVYADAISYPLDIGGRPEFSWPAFVPIAFEIGVLCAMLAGFVGYIIVNRLPQLYNPVDEGAAFPRAMRDGWLVAVRTADHGAIAQARNVLAELHPATVEELPA